MKAKDVLVVFETIPEGKPYCSKIELALLSKKL